MRLIWFENKTRKEVRELREEIKQLRQELRYRTEIIVGDHSWPEPFLLYILTGAKPTVQLKDIIHHLVERMGLEIKRVPGVPERTVIERKPKLKPYINIKGDRNDPA